MNLKDMLDKLEEIENSSVSEADPISGDMNKMVQDIDDAKARDQVPSSQLTKITKDLTGKSAQTVDQQIDRLRNSQVPAIRDIIKKADMFDDLLNGPLKSQIAGEIQKMQKNPGQDPDSDYRADRMANVDTEIDDSIDYDLLDLQDINEGLNKECQDMYNKLMKTDPEKANKFKAMCMKLGPDCTVDQAMTAMDNMKEASPSAQATKYAKDSGQSAQQLDRGVTQLGKRQDVASQGASKLASDMQRLLNSPYANQVLRFLQDLDKQEPQQLAADMQYENIEEALQNPEVLDVLKEFTADVSLPILQDVVGGDKVLAQNAKIALRNIGGDKGINKRFMPAVRKLLSKLTDMLSSGGMGALAQFDQLHNQHTSGESPEVGTGGIADPDAVQDSDDIEFSDEEVMAWAKEKGLPITHGDQIASAREQMKQEKMAQQADEPTSDEPGERPKDNTGRPLNMQDESIQELKQLAGLEEAMSDAYGVVPSEDKLEGSVEYKQHKNNDKGSVSVEASAETMDDLHDILKLAGVDMAMDLNKTEKGDDADHDHDEEPKEPVEPEAPCDADEPEDKKVMVISPNDASYSTDKEVLVNYLKDKLKKSIS
mgnify:FL=1